jgi:bifunctional oligoribonuclease and PAP phosphatase NrnA
VKVPHNLLSFLKQADDFFIATHINPEGDALGSSIALSMALETLGKKTLVYDRDPVPDYYRFLPGHERLIHSSSGIETSAFNLLLLDCNTPDRAGLEAVEFRSSAVIDHHETEKEFGTIKWVEPHAAATGMMIFSLIKELGTPITKEIALNLYAALAIDTGTFRYDNTTAEVMKVASELVEAGAKPYLVSNNLYETWSEQRFRLLIMCLNTLEIRENVAFTAVTNEMFQRTGTSAEDTENFSGFPRMMQNVVVSAFFRQIADNGWKVSLRSKGVVNVAEIAALCGGGGHKNAAGFTIKGSLETAKEKLLRHITGAK